MKKKKKKKDQTSFMVFILSGTGCWKSLRREEA